MQVLLTIRNINTSRDTAGCKCDNIKGGEIWSKELVFLKLVRPWQFRQETLSRRHQLGKLSTHGLVDYCNKT